MVATVTSSSIAAGFTQTQVKDTLKAAFNAAGFGTPYDDYTSGSTFGLVYELIGDVSKARGRAYYQITIATGTTFATIQTLYTTWNSTAHSGTNPGVASTSFSLNPVNDLSIKGFNGGAEFKLLQIMNGALTSNLSTMGWFRPQNKDPFWEEDSYPYFFIPRLTAGNSLITGVQPTASHPIGGGTAAFTTNAGLAAFASPHPVSAKRHFKNLEIYAPTQGQVGATSNDLSVGAANGMAALEVLTIDGETYTVVLPGAGGLIVRTA